MDKYTLVGVDGNAFSVMGYVVKAMRTEGLSAAEISEYTTLAMSGNYDQLIALSVDELNKLNACGCSDSDCPECRDS